MPRYELVIFNDEEHCFAYVHELLMRELTLSNADALAFVESIHLDGLAGIVLALDVAKSVHARVLAEGPDTRLQGEPTSLIAAIAELEEGRRGRWVVPPTRTTPHGPETFDDAAIAGIQRESLRRHHATFARGYASSCAPSLAAVLRGAGEPFRKRRRL